MALISLTTSSLLILYASSVRIIEHYYWKNYGQFYYDYSENQQFAMNGLTSQIESEDVIHTDRGIYLDGTTFITVHNNIWDLAIPLPDEFSISIWAMPTSLSGCLYSRWSTTRPRLQASFTTTNELEFSFYLYDSSVWTLYVKKSSTTAPLNTWTLVMIGIDRTSSTSEYYMELYEDKFSEDLGNKLINEPTSGEEYLGYIGVNQDKTDYFNGFVHEFIVRDEDENTIDLGTSSPTCYNGAGSAYCICDHTPGVTGNCPSSNPNPLENGYGVSCGSCPNSCWYDTSICLECTGVDLPTCSEFDSVSSFTSYTCDTDCDGCSGPEETDCTGCDNSNYTVISPPGPCECAYGTFDTGTICSNCPDDCSSCDSSLNCSECEIAYSIPTGGNNPYCECESENTEVNSSNTACECLPGFINEGDVIMECVKNCHESCEDCDGFTDNDCLACNDGGILIGEGTCIYCEDDEYLSSVDVYSCEECSSICKTCSDFEYCTSCENELQVLIEGECMDLCEEGEYQDGNECFECEDLCIQCEGLENCNECMENAEFETGLCKCLEGFEEISGSCELVEYFEGNMEVDTDNELEVEFEEELEFRIEESEIEIEIKNIDFDWKLKSSDTFSFKVVLDFEEVVKAGTEVILVLEGEIQSKNEYYLENYEFEGELEDFFPEENEIPFIGLDNSFQIYMLILVFSAGEISGEPSPVWVLISYVQIIAFIPLSTNHIPYKTAQYLKSLANITFIPNLYQHYYKKDENIPNFESRKYGIQSGTFLMNSGWQFTIISVALLANFSFWLLSYIRVGFIQKICNFFLKDYKYGFYLRFFIEAYIELVLASILQCMNVRFKQTDQEGYLMEFNKILGALGLIFVIISPIILFHFTSYNTENIKDDNYTEFQNKWGSFYYEFNKSSTVTHYFYFLFLVRRLLFIGSELILNGQPILQNVLGTVLQLVVRSNEITLFLITQQPYRNKLVQFNTLITEILTVLVFLLCLCFEFSEFEDVYEQINFSIVVITLGVTLYLVLSSLVSSIFNIFKKILKRIKGSVEEIEGEFEIEELDNIESKPEYMNNTSEI